MTMTQLFHPDPSLRGLHSCVGPVTAMSSTPLTWRSRYISPVWVSRRAFFIFSLAFVVWNAPVNYLTVSN